MKRTIIPAAALALIATSALANTPSFYDVDTNNDNKVTWDELSAALPSASLFDFRAVDQNSDGSISATEMTNNISALDLEPGDTAVSTPSVEINNAPVAAATAFTVIDTDNSNSVSWDELSAAAPDVSLFDFSEADQNGDGVLSESELANGAKYLEQYNADDVVQSDGGPVVNQPEIETKKGS